MRALTIAEYEFVTGGDSQPPYCYPCGSEGCPGCDGIPTDCTGLYMNSYGVEPDSYVGNLGNYYLDQDLHWFSTVLTAGEVQDGAIPWDAINAILAVHPEYEVVLPYIDFRIASASLLQRLTQNAGVPVSDIYGFFAYTSGAANVSVSAIFVNPANPITLATLAHELHHLYQAVENPNDNNEYHQYMSACMQVQNNYDICYNTNPFEQAAFDAEAAVVMQLP